MTGDKQHGSILHSASCVAVGGPNSSCDEARAILIQGEPGSGKSSLALALIDRGAVLIGDDGVRLTPHMDHPSREYLLAEPPPNISGLLELRNVGLLQYPTTSAPVALIIQLDANAPRLPQGAKITELAGHSIPTIALYPDSPVLHLRAEQALARFGLPPLGSQT